MGFHRTPPGGGRSGEMQLADGGGQGRPPRSTRVSSCGKGSLSGGGFIATLPQEVSKRTIQSCSLENKHTYVCTVHVCNISLQVVLGTSVYIGEPKGRRAPCIHLSTFTICSHLRLRLLNLAPTHHNPAKYKREGTKPKEGFGEA